MEEEQRKREKRKEKKEQTIVNGKFYSFFFFSSLASVNVFMCELKLKSKFILAINEKPHLFNYPKRPKLNHRSFYSKLRCMNMCVVYLFFSLNFLYAYFLMGKFKR